MKASDYTQREFFDLGIVRLVQKAKNCGKENCVKCPHKGYWYARLPSYFVREGMAREIYLGHEWTDADLRRKVAPLLRPGRDKSFLALIDQQVTREEIAERMDQAKDTAEHKRQVEAEFKRRYHLLEVEEKNNARAIEVAQKRLKALGKTVRAGA
jgi:hypothetical protein